MIRCAHCETTINPGIAIYRDGVGYCDHGCLTKAIAAVIEKFDMMRGMARWLTKV